jgi:hypothetical protein
MNKPNRVVITRTSVPIKLAARAENIPRMQLYKAEPAATQMW